MDQLLKTLFRRFTLTSRAYTFYGGFVDVLSVTLWDIILRVDTIVEKLFLYGGMSGNRKILPTVVFLR